MVTFVGVTSLDEEEYVVLTSLGGRISAWRKWRGQPYARVGRELNFSPTNHRFRRVREQNGMLFVELSPNGQTWTQPPGWAVANFFTTPDALYGNVKPSTTKVKAHDEENTAGIGDRVILMETRPLSATKRWRLVRIVEKAK
jgi:ribosomal protein S17